MGQQPPVTPTTGDAVLPAGNSSARPGASWRVAGAAGGVCRRRKPCETLPPEGLRNVDELDLARTETTDAGLEHLKGLTNLLDLKLYETEVTEARVASLRQALPRCYVFASPPQPQ